MRHAWGPVSDVFSGNGSVAYGLTSLDLPTAAATLAYKGWAVFPVDAESKVPLVKDWPNVASTDAKQVHQWWRKFPNASIGYATGILTVVEIDGEEGLASMNALRAVNPWPPTLSSMSGRGLHFFYASPEPIRNCVGLSQDGKRGLGKGIDVRGQGGFVVLPPSRHSNGRVYRWVQKVAPVCMPEWMTERLRSPTVEPGPPVEISDATRYVQTALEQELASIRDAPEGALNHAVNRAAFALGRFVASGELDDEEVYDALVREAEAAGHPSLGAQKTVRSGLNGGMRRG